MKCSLCQRDFPEHLVSDLVIGFGDKKPPKSCPICARAKLNAAHGLPPDTPFRGSQAAALYNEAVKYLAKPEPSAWLIDWFKSMPAEWQAGLATAAQGGSFMGQLQPLPGNDKWSGVVVFFVHPAMAGAVQRLIADASGVAGKG